MINNSVVKEMYDFFERYINTYDFTGEDRHTMKLLKYEHTMEVTKLCRQISGSIFNNEQDVYISEIIGLFHDIGRWKQFYLYRTFEDYNSEDHAKLSVDVLNENKVLNKLDKGEKQIILDSIYEHNKKYIANIKDEKTLIFAKIIRDADRIDNYRVECDNFDTKDEKKKVKHFYPQVTGISREVYSTIKNNKLVDYRDVKSVNDAKCCYLAWIFDMSFQKSFEIVKGNNYIDRIYKNMQDLTPEIIECFEIFNKFVNKKLA